MGGEGGRGRAKYRRIADDLREAVTRGRYGPGDRLPGENDLMASYEVARMTARQALGVLQSEGIAESRKGAGVFVRTFRPLRRRGIERVAENRWGHGRSIWAADTEDRETVVDHLRVTEEAAPAGIGGVLALAAGDTVCVRRRRYVLDGKPVLLAASYLPAALVSGSAVTSADPGPGGIYARLAELGHAPAHFREEIRSRMPSADEADRLELGTGTPVILVCRTAFTADGRAVEVNEMTMDAASYVLEYDFDA
ncbi:putative GntR family transcriptional regulator [Actinacidiphila reveromycinica]|uniref:Putative GntR family transcriptional regulator n=1 Tax=Actinacidiphila reveromycinica TaxID=659352 RepID=A0A7U3UQ65_9ACTN|nr:GntR family transcriptional regulator [Streptomyces sp. SN-593]BBA96631.1 putative GntR family transcriptional regulator [Streptomyces sp. SN-593]